MNTTTLDKSVVDKLNGLLTRAYDAEEGYKLAAELTENHGLKTFFEDNAKQRYDFGHRLKDILSQHDEVPDKGTSAAGQIHQSFMKLRASLTDENNEALIAEARRGDEKALEDYQDVIESELLSPEIAEAVVSQKSHVEEQLVALDTIQRAMEGH